MDLWRRIRRVYDFVDEPRIHRLLWSAQYIILCVGGVVMAATSPGIIQDHFGNLGATVWGLAVSGGGLVGAIFCLKHWWLWERIAIWLIAGGCLAFLAVSTWLVLNGLSGNYSQIVLSAAVLVSLVRRFVEIMRYNVEPGF